MDCSNHTNISQIHHKNPVKHVCSDSIYFPQLHVSDIDTDTAFEANHIHPKPRYKRASSYPLESNNIQVESQRLNDYMHKGENTNMDRRNKLAENGQVYNLRAQETSVDSSQVPKGKSRTDRKHHRLKQSRSLEHAVNISNVDRVSSDKSTNDEKGKHRRSSEKIRKSESSKYRNEKSAGPPSHHLGSVHREETNLTYSYPLFKSDDNQNNDSHKQTEHRKLQEKSSNSSSLKSSKDSNLSAKESSSSKYISEESKTSKLRRHQTSDKHEKRIGLDKNSSPSPETSSNELPLSKKRKSRSKRKEILRKHGCSQPTFYGISGTDCSYPLSTSATNGNDRDKISKSSFKLTSANLAVLETGHVHNEIQTGGSSFRRKRCSALALLSAACLVLTGVVATLIVLFLTSSDSTDDIGFDMIRAHIRLRIINRNYTESMKNISHFSFTLVSEPFCDEVDYLFLTSSLHSEYFGCSAKEIKSGSILLYYITPFLNSKHVQNVSNIRNILSGKDRDADQATNKGLGSDNVYLGDFLIDINSISIELENYKSPSLPKRPRLVVKGLESTSISIAQPALVTKPSSTKRINAFASATSTPYPSSKTSPKSAAKFGTLISSTISTASIPYKSTASSEAATLSSQTPVKSFVNRTTVIYAKTDTPSPSITRYENRAMTTSPSWTGANEEKRKETSLRLTQQEHSLMATDFLSSTGFYEEMETSTPFTEQQPMIKSSNCRFSSDTSFVHHNKFSSKKSSSYSHEKTTCIEIEMTSTEVYLNQKPTYLKCTVRDLKYYSGQISIYYQQTREAESKTIVMLVNEGKIYSTMFRETQDNLRISHKSEDYSVTLDLKFEKVTCTDTGLYTCELKSRGKEYRAAGYLKGLAVPGKPTLYAPSSLIEGQELLEPITCTADVGYPAGTLSFQIKPRGHTRFFPVPEGASTTTGPCKNNRTISLTYTPTREANGTLLKCVVENTNVPHIMDLSSFIELQVIAGNICDGHRINKTLRHPFECDKYLLCLEKHFEVHQCDKGVCFDQTSGTCGQTSLNMKGVVAYLNEGVASLKCRLTHTGSWNQMAMFKAYPSGERLKIVTVERGQQPLIHNSSMKDRVFANVEIETRYELELNVWVYVLTCDDQGDYFCAVDAPFKVPEAKGYIDIRVKPSAPTLSVPNEIIEGLPTRYNFTCEADVGYPHGQLVLKMKLQHESDFHLLSFEDELIEEEKNCSKVVKRTFQFIPSMDHNGLTFLCEVQNPVTLPAGHTMVTSEVIHVVPGNFCQTHEDNTPHMHPYDCHQYVQCSEDYIYVQRCGSDHCFDPETLRCDAPDPKSKHTFDPSYPCRPNQNGIFFHHPFLCNKYIWCVQGEEIVQHCPIGTLYIDGGQCTFDANQSRCYKTEDSRLLS